MTPRRRDEHDLNFGFWRDVGLYPQMKARPESIFKATDPRIIDRATTLRKGMVAGNGVTAKYPGE